MTDTEVWNNNKSAGPKHQGGFYRFKYEITDLVKASDNLLEVTVSKVSSDRSVEEAERQADYWAFGGIYRPVYLEAVPKQFVEWIAADTRADGTFRADIHLNGNEDAESITAEIIGLGRPFEAKLEPDREKVTLQTQVQGHKTWTAETPNLYTIRVSLQQGGQSVHTVTKRFGFRTFDVRHGDGLYLNGQRVRLKGVCRHSFWPDSGRCLSKEISSADVRLIQELNMNAVRMSHYTPDEHFLDACDELGLHVLDELSGWQKPPCDTEIGTKLVKEIWSPVHIDLEALPPDFDGVKVENRYDFTNLRDCRFEVKLMNLPGPADKTSRAMGIIRRGMDSPDIPPHQQGTLRLDLPADWRKADVLYLTAYDPGKHVIWTWSWHVQGIGHSVDECVKRTSQERVVLQEAGNQFRVTAGTLTLVIDGQSRSLKQVAWAGHDIDSHNGPRLIGGEGRVKRVTTQQGDITIVNATPELFLGVYRPNDGPLPASTRLSVPETGIALLHGIPALGTKFDKPEVLGPQSQKNSASGVYRGTVWFRFGD